ncbi:MAG: membrane protein insertase YidC, partial [Acidobacteriota bacterium]|nr:membrane protein insertase YidC [Acidobacteriota bacterium]
FFAPPPPPPTPSHAKAPITAKSEAAAKPGLKGSPASAPAPKVVLPVVEGSEAKEIVVENNFYRVTLSTRGGVVKSWILRKYEDATNHPLDVVNDKACAQLGYPMSIMLQDAALTAEANSSIYVADPAGATLSAPAHVTFTYSNGKIRVKKEFFFGPEYQVRVKVAVSDGNHDLPVSVRWPGGVGDQSLALAAENKQSKAFYDHGGGIKTVAEKKVKETQMIPGPLSFAGLEDNFFAGVFLPVSPESVFSFSRESWDMKDAKGNQTAQSLVAVLGTAQASPLEFRMFVTPKELDVLGAENPALEALVDFGWFSVIAKPLFLGMRYIYDHGVPNWGWAIVIFTVVINMLFFPLKIKSIRSAQAMQKVQPIIKGIQDKYKQYKFNDPRKQKMNQEVMKVYQEHGVNPLGGCLPMAVQLPIIYAFYEVLETSIAMRHSPWIWWIKDLSVRDPYYILPILAMVLSYFMQKMTPMPTVDPAQQKMMTMMPLFIGFIFFYEAAGLTLYYFVYCLIAVLQQLLINRLYPPPAQVSPPAPPAAGKTQATPTSQGKRQAPGPRRPAPVKG